MFRDGDGIWKPFYMGIRSRAIPNMAEHPLTAPRQETAETPLTLCVPALSFIFGSY